MMQRQPHTLGRQEFLLHFPAHFWQNKEVWKEVWLALAKILEISESHIFLSHLTQKKPRSFNKIIQVLPEAANLLNFNV